MTPHQERIVGLKLEGYSHSQIAQQLKVTSVSIDITLHRLYKTCNARNFIDFCRIQGWLKVSLQTYKFNATSGLGA